MSARFAPFRCISPGEARRPGVYTVSSLSTLVDALFAGGGPSAAGSFRHIELRRAGTVVTDFDLYSLLVHGDKSKDVALQNGDVLFIPPVGPQVAITGSVKHPAIYELRAGDSLDEALADAGGASVVAAQARVSIERTDEHRDRYRDGGCLGSGRPRDDARRRRPGSCFLHRPDVSEDGHAARQHGESGPFRLASRHAHQRSDPGQGFADYAELLVEARADGASGS